MLGLMSNKNLLISSLLEHSSEYHGNTEIAHRLTNGKIEKTNYKETNLRTRKLAKSLINRPEILLLDEPTASLDPDIGDFIRSYIQDYKTKNEVTILLASHNMNEVERLCDSIIMMRKGKIIGEHEVLFSSGKEMIKLNHKAFDFFEPQQIKF